MKVEKIIDLTITITDSTPIYPGDPKPSFCHAAKIETDGYNVSAVQLGSHTGTHVDAPFHFLEDGSKIDELPLQRFIGKGIVFDVRGKEKGSAITLEDINDKIEQCEEGDIALFLTGWTSYMGQDLYYEHPYLHISLVKELINIGIKTFFIDALNIDAPGGSSFEAHYAILEANGVIGENFTNFELIDFNNPLIIALPLKLKDLDGSPVRAVAIKTN